MLAFELASAPSVPGLFGDHGARPIPTQPQVPVLVLRKRPMALLIVASLDSRCARLPRARRTRDGTCRMRRPVSAAWVLRCYRCSQLGGPSLVVELPAEGFRAAGSTRHRWYLEARTE